MRGSPSHSLSGLEGSCSFDWMLCLGRYTVGGDVFGCQLTRPTRLQVLDWHRVSGRGIG